MVINTLSSWEFTERTATQRVRHGGLYATLTKEIGFGLHNMLNCKKVTRIYLEEVMEDQSYFSKVCLGRLPMLTLFLIRITLLFPGTGQDRRTLSQREIYPLFIGR